MVLRIAPRLRFTQKPVGMIAEEGFVGRTQMGLFDPLREPSHLGAREVLDLRRERAPGCGVTFEEASAG